MAYPSTLPMLHELTVGSRQSALAKAQVIEIQREINKHFSSLTFDCIFVKTTGDKDQATSLRTLDKTDFFTKEIDALLLSGGCRIAIHSAKDLPDPLPKGLALIALTHGLDPDDVVVLKKGVSLSLLPPKPIIATSSVRREEAVRQLIPNATFIDLRGTIEQRLTRLHGGGIDGVVVAEAALIRLGLTHLNRVKLPGPTAPLQGKLAIVTREGDLEMQALFQSLDSRQG